MAVNSLKTLLFIAGGVVVVAGAAYVTGALDAVFLQKPQVVSQPSPEAPGGQPPAAAVEVDAPKPGGQQMAALPAQEQPAAVVADEAKVADLVVPSFDLVRVEPDGSVVIAGHAAPHAKVEVVTGSNVIGTDTAGVEGDFAVVVEVPLKPGDYTIVLRSTTPDNVVATSEETAIVSVPDNKAGQVLALVEKPGAPSKLITVPQAEAPATETAPAGQETPAGSDAPGAAGAPAATAPQQPAPAVTQQDADSAAQQPATPAQPSGETASAAGAQQSTVDKPAEETQQAADAPVATPAGEQAGATPDGEKTPAQAQADAAPAGAPAAAEPQQVASATAEQDKPAPAAAAEKPRISVDAVEIEGTRVFVAGRTMPNGHVRAYANEILLGDATASPAGQYLVEAQRELPVGDYIVRADLLGPRAEVVARAAVPFEREPGESISAVAAAESAAAPAKEEKPAAAAQAGDVQPPAPEAAGQAADGGAIAAVAGSEGKPAAGDAVEPTAPKLQSVAGAVIIRRGDTLWRISRRVYGLGVRYTTIYLANQEQISDPDRIWPGQVFSVPEKTDDGEQADLSAVADRVVPAQ